MPFQLSAKFIHIAGAEIYIAVSPPVRTKMILRTSPDTFTNPIRI